MTVVKMLRKFNCIRGKGGCGLKFKRKYVVGREDRVQCPNCGVSNKFYRRKSVNKQTGAVEWQVPIEVIEEMVPAGVDMGDVETGGEND